MIDKLTIESINTNFLNQYSASSEELLAEAMDQFGLLDDNTLINNINARDHLKSLLEKKKTYHGVLTRKASFISKLGSLLIQKNLINTIQLKEALNYQKQTSFKIGEALVKLGFIREEEIADIIEEQKKIRNVLEKINDAEEIEVRISYKEPLFEKTIGRQSKEPYTVSHTVDTSDVSEAIIESLTAFFTQEKENSVNWKSRIVGININIGFDDDNDFIED